jgi:TusA-related sulfurtransferase
MESSSPEMQIDQLGQGCASVLIELARAARTLRSASLGSRPKPMRIELLTDDRGAPTELPAGCRMTGHRFDGAAAPDCYRLTLYPESTDRRKP